MNVNKMTEKVQAALMEAQSIAQRRGQQQLEGMKDGGIPDEIKDEVLGMLRQAFFPLPSFSFRACLLVITVRK